MLGGEGHGLMSEEGRAGGGNRLQFLETASRARYSGDPPVDINKKVSDLTIRVLIFIITAVLFWFAGTATEVFWNLNGKVSTFEGRIDAAKELYQLKLDAMASKNADLEKKIRYLECVNDKAVKDKSGCHQ